MKKIFTDESDTYNELMLNISNSSVLSDSIKTHLESLIIGALNAGRRDGVNKLSVTKMLKNEDSMKFYNDIKTLFKWDMLLSDKFKTYVLETVLFIMEEKNKSETKRLHKRK